MISASALKKTVRPSEHERPDIVRARTAWHQHAPTWNLDQLVFLDETGVTRICCGAMAARSRVYARRAPAQYVSAALRVTGLTAPAVFEGAIDGPSFLAYLDQILVPTLRPGDIVIADNLGAHKVRGVEDLLAAAGAAMWYLPPYSPAIGFAKLSDRCRSVETLWPLLGQAPTNATTFGIAGTQALNDLKTALVDCTNHL